MTGGRLTGYKAGINTATCPQAYGQSEAALTLAKIQLIIK